MKSFVKKWLYTSLALSLLFALTHCNKNEEEEPDNADYLCEILSFGFYAEDNADMNLDYPGVINGTNITVALPTSINRNGLVARFEVTLDDVVNAGSTLFESKITPYNYTSTVDLTVNDPVSKLTKIYSVHIVAPPEKVWTKFGDLTKTTYDLNRGAYAMKLDPSDGRPVIAYGVNEVVEGTTTLKVAVSKWNGSAFALVGNEAFSERVATSIDLAIDNSGKPYIAYLDYNENTQASVMAYSGGSWSYVGARGGGSGYRANTTPGIALGLTPGTTQNPVMITIGNVSADPFYRAPEFAYYNGSWNTGIGMPGRPAVSGSSYAAYRPKAVTFGDYVYFSTANNGTTNGYSLYKFRNGSVTTVLEGKFIDGGSSATSIQDNSFAIASDETIYYLSADDVGGTWQLRVFTYKEGVDAAPKQLGSTINHVVTTSSSYTIALDKNDLPYIAFNKSNTERQLMVANFDMETRNWTDPIAISGTDEIKTNPEKIYLEFDNNNIGYAAAIGNVAPYRIFVYKLE